MVFDEEKFDELKKRSEEFYQNLTPIICPALGETVHFTSDGFHHLRFDGTRAERSKAEQLIKLRFLRKAIDVIRKTTTIQEYRKEVIPIGKCGKDGFRKTAEVKYWAFVAIVSDGCKIKVILRRVGDGQFHFWSVMAFWKETKFDNGQTVKRMGSMKLSDE